MEFWSGILGAIVGGAIALVGTIFSSVSEHRCQRESELRLEKKRIYTDICNILGGVYRISVIVDPDATDCASGKIDTAIFSRISEDLGAYMEKHAGEIVLYLPHVVYSSLIKIRADLYNVASSNLTTSPQTFSSDLELINNIIIKVSNLENKIKNDLYPTNRSHKKGEQL